MNIASVTVPSSWEPFRSEIKTCLEFYTTVAATPFQVNVNADGKEGGREIAVYERPDDKEQDWILEFAVNDFNLRTQSSPSQDLPTVVFDFRNELSQQRRVKADHFRKWLLRRIMKKSVSDDACGTSPDTPSTPGPNLNASGGCAPSAVLAGFSGR